MGDAWVRGMQFQSVVPMSSAYATSVGGRERQFESPNKARIHQLSAKLQGLQQGLEV